MNFIIITIIFRIIYFLNYITFKYIHNKLYIKYLYLLRIELKQVYAFLINNI